MAAPGPSKDLDWMYTGPSALVNREDYLLGRAVDKSFQLLEAQEKAAADGSAFSYADEVEKDLTPASIFANRGKADRPVDIIKKIKEDPLYQIEKKEQETLKQLLQNPIKMKQLKKLADQQKHESKSKKQKKRKNKRSRSSSSSSSSDSDSGKKLDKSTLDRLLASKLNALKKYKNRQSSSSSSSCSESEEDTRRNKNRRRDKERDNRERHDRNSSSHKEDFRRDRRRDDYGTRRERSRDRHERRDRNEQTARRSRSPNYRNNNRDKGSSSSSSYRSSYQQRDKMSEQEMEKRRMEMMANAKVRGEDRKKNVERWREEQRKEDEELAKEHESDFIRKHLLNAAESGSIEKRIKSNSYNIQKSTSAMSQNFARR